MKKMRIVIRTAAAVMCLCIISAAFCGCGGEDGNMRSHTEPAKLSDYLYYLEFSDYRLDMETDAEDAVISGGCSSVRCGNFFGRNLDLTYSETPEFVVKMKRGADRFASISVCADPNVASYGNGLSDEVISHIPDIANDGINENGVAVSVHVAVPVGVDDMTGTAPGKDRLDAVFAVRYLLDHAESADHALSLLNDLDIVGDFGGYALHWMIADDADTYIVEIIGNKLTVSKNENYCLTNFYMNYGPVMAEQTAAGTVVKDLPKLSDFAVGVERFDVLRKGYGECGTFDGMLEMMKRVRATASYDRNNDPLWYTEFTNLSLPIQSTKEDFAAEFERQCSLFENRSRSDPKGDWITWHTSVYDIGARKLFVYSQENYEGKFEFSLKK